MEKLIIEVRINEYASRQHNPNVPFSPEEISEEALRCWRQGASPDPLSRARPPERRTIIKDRALRGRCPAYPRQERPYRNADPRCVDPAVAGGADEPHYRDGEESCDPAGFCADRHGYEQRRHLRRAQSAFPERRCGVFEPDQDAALLCRNHSWLGSASLCCAVEREFDPRHRGVRRSRAAGTAALWRYRADRGWPARWKSGNR